MKRQRSWTRSASELGPLRWHHVSRGNVRLRLDFIFLGTLDYNGNWHRGKYPKIAVRRRIITDAWLDLYLGYIHYISCYIYVPRRLVRSISSHIVITVLPRVQLWHICLV